MNNFWEPVKPSSSELGDHDVPILGRHLSGKKIALLVSGGIAAMKAPLLARELRRYGAEITAFVSEEALRYVTEDTLEWSTNNPVITKLTPRAEHLSDSIKFAAYLVAPATYNTINKFRYGIADGLLTSTLASALGRSEAGKTKIIFVPTMHGSMHNSIFSESISSLQKMGVNIIPPRDAYGKHNLPDIDFLAIETCRILSSSPLLNVPVMVTGGPTPVPLDSVRRITTRFSGRLGILTAMELYMAGADVLLIHGEGSLAPPAFLPHLLIRDYSEYKKLVLEKLAEKNYYSAIFSAAVADYQPAEVFEGKIPSGKNFKIGLVQTSKVIREVREKFPDLYMVTFKFEQNISHEKLVEIARGRIAEGYQAVIANRGEEQGKGDEQVGYLLTKNQEEIKLVTKQAITEAIVKNLEENYSKPGS
jgi:phosphopantothenoylcysteine decarboxylase/phosphopantothenate--cysteine ligase